MKLYIIPWYDETVQTFVVGEVEGAFLAYGIEQLASEQISGYSFSEVHTLQGEAVASETEAPLSEWVTMR